MTKPTDPSPEVFSVLQSLPAWLGIYNTIYPYSGLRMHSPYVFIAEQSANPAKCLV